MIHSKVRGIIIGLELIDSLTDQITIIVGVENSLDSVPAEVLDALVTGSREADFTLSVQANYH
jgi:hypothetical protein